MLRTLATIGLFLTLVLPRPVSAAQPEPCPFNLPTGHWVGADETGYTSEVHWEVVAHGAAVLGHWKDNDGATFIELVGWKADQRQLVSKAFGSNGAYWELTSNLVTPTRLEALLVDRRPDGKTYRGKFEMIKVSDDEYQTLFMGSDGTRHDLQIKGSYKRRKP